MYAPKVKFSLNCSHYEYKRSFKRLFCYAPIRSRFVTCICTLDCIHFVAMELFVSGRFTSLFPCLILFQCLFNDCYQIYIYWYLHIYLYHNIQNYIFCMKNQLCTRNFLMQYNSFFGRQRTWFKHDFICEYTIVQILTREFYFVNSLPE